MRRFLELALALLALALGLYFALYRASLPLDLHRGEELTVPYRVEGRTLMREVDGKTEELSLRGVELSSAVPGHHFSDYAASTEDYLRWMDEIAELGANMITITQLMDDEFYDALLEHNTTHERPLLLVQGIMVEEEFEQSSRNAFDSGLMSRLIQQGKVVADAIHGRRDVMSGGIGGSGSYRSDVSEWVAALLIVEDFDVDNVAYTDMGITHDAVFEGEQFKTTDEATPFEAMLAEVMDAVTSYETKKYDTQRPCGFTSSPLTDVLEYEEVYARQLGKYVCVDPEHVVATKENEAGTIGAYRISGVAEGFADYLSKDCKKRLKDLLADLEDDALYDGYLRLLSAYHSIPLVGFFSSSTARTTDSQLVAAADEREQGEALVEVAEELEEAGWTGACISSWQDVWSRSNWNTAYATFVDNGYLWHDLETPQQCEGLLAFDPGEEAACVLDGVSDEWDEDDVVISTGGLTLSARYDAEGLYLLVDGATADDVVYVPIDVSREVGVKSSADPELSFGGEPEFLLCLAGTKKSELRVLSRYDATRERFLYDLEGEDPFVEVVEADDDSFDVVTRVQTSGALLDEDEYSKQQHTSLVTTATGKLTCGVGDPTSDEYDSRADFCYGDECVEVRLPWLLLNVGDPSTMLAHRDYYDHYGVEFKQTRYLGMGLTRKGETDTIPFASFNVSGWKSVAYRERLKQSYDVVRDAWGAGE